MHNSDLRKIPHFPELPKVSSSAIRPTPALKP